MVRIKSKGNPLLALPVAFIIMIFFGVSEIHNSHEQKNWDLKETTGKVTDFHKEVSRDSDGDKQTDCKGVITYKVRESSYQVRSSSCSNYMGKNVKIYYDNNQPSHGVTRLASSTLGYAILGGAFLVLFITIAIGVYLFRKAKKLGKGILGRMKQEKNVSWTPGGEEAKFGLNGSQDDFPAMPQTYEDPWKE